MTDTETALRAHLRSHNGGVVAASGMALAFSAAGWVALYAASCWITMFVLAVKNSGEMGKPAAFDSVFFGTAAVLLLAARADQFFFPSERAVDERPPMEHFADVLFFVPRFTMSCWQNLGALARLSPSEMRDAALLLDSLKTGRRIAVQELPSRFPDERGRRRVLDALLVSGLIDLRTGPDATWIYIGALAPAAFRDQSGALPAPDDPLAGVPQVKIRSRVRLLRGRNNRGARE